MTEKEVQCLIAERLGLGVVAIPNVLMIPSNHTGYGYEADLLYFRTQSPYLYEIEIKCYYDDFINDFKKKMYHNNDNIRGLYYAFPDGIWECHKDDIQDVLKEKNPGAGIMIASYSSSQNLIFKRCKLKKVKQLTIEQQMHYMRIGCYKWWKREFNPLFHKYLESL